MTTAAFLLVIGSAISHTTWNFLLKRSNDKSAFLWSLGSLLILAGVLTLGLAP